MMFLYYRFVSTYHREPIDPDDFFDGIRNIVAESDISALAFGGK